VIIVRLEGGLGNQLFQYAFGRGLAIANRTALKLDMSQVKGWYGLSHFNVIEDFASPEEISRLRSPSLRNPRTFLTDLLNPVRPYYRRSMIKEVGPTFDPKMLKARKSVYLVGFWQNEGYFKAVEPIIRKEFTVKRPPDRTSGEMAARIRETESVCLHVRRGDMANDPELNRFHGTCSPEYYQHAATRMAASVSKPHFFIFSDDHAWTQENVRLSYPMTRVLHNGPTRDYEDLRLMSLCKHFVIANSSFSWWGAWLSIHRQKIVVAPRRWANDPVQDADTELPQGWIRLD
jgi:hypothetical protein